ncbi:hypothetical protein MIT9_P2449 [Methylomarinovum caldicuralii]|uniref:DUF2267 domain-containing protein n=1 Tax=Methylomarinovum caldicuralii TaxID=438856 RepID=A0AAU9C535_9GAMM|nr:DUF2267 domain-containing protein [Methylomarinovum caldicuralii]BCX82858.1 hypothetical protein MIT9_P2449 [Methylomarinovum caldicuralii]
MTAGTGFDPIDRTVQKTFEWLKEIEQDLGSDDRYRAYHALRSVLHHLRDRLTVNEAADLAAELPLLIRGIFYEGWNPAKVPVKIRHRDEFLGLIARDFPEEPEENAEKIARAVFNVLRRHVAAGEIEDVLNALPKELRELVT